MYESSAYVLMYPAWELSKELRVSHRGVFVSCNTSNMRLCFHRSRYNRVTLDRVLNNIEEYDVAIGEDPRIFSMDGFTYVLNNYMNNLTLIELDKSGNVYSYRRIRSSIAKNAVPLVLGVRKLALLDFEKKMAYGMIIGTNEVTVRTSWSLQYTGDDRFKCILRGGTPAVRHQNQWVGVGHCTNQMSDDVTTHIPFLWRTHDVEHLKMESVSLPTFSKIVDPTSLFIDNEYRWKLITAESNFSWFRNQTYYNRVYVSRRVPRKRDFGTVRSVRP